MSIVTESKGGVKKYAKARLAKTQATSAGARPVTQPVTRTATNNSCAPASTTGRSQSASSTVTATDTTATPYRTTANRAMYRCIPLPLSLRRPRR